MKRLALLALLLAPCAYGQTVLQTNQSSNGNIGVQRSIAVTTKAQTPNSIIFVQVQNTCTAAPGLSDGTHAWIQDKLFTGPNGGVTHFHAANSGTAATTITATSSGCGYNAIEVEEVSGVSGTIDAQASASSAAAPSTTLTIGTLTLSNTDFIVAAANDNFGAGGLSAGTGFIFINTVNSPAAAEYMVNTGSINVFFALAQAGYKWEGSVVAYKGGGGGTNPLPPTVSLGPPIISGSITLTTNISDNVPISNVQFLLDGALLGTVSTTPYNFQWNTTTATNAQHTISAKATNTSGQSAVSSGQTYIVNNIGTQLVTGNGKLVVGNAVAPLSITSPFTMPQATVGQAYSANIGTVANVTGGTPPYSYALSSGTLPAGLALSATGTVSGTPTTAGTSNFSVTVTDSSGVSQLIEMRVVAGQ